MDSAHREHDLRAVFNGFRSIARTGNQWHFMPHDSRRGRRFISRRRTLQSTPESGERAGYDGAKWRTGSKVHIAVDTLGHLLALRVTPADQGDRAQVETRAEEMQAISGATVEMAFVDHGSAGPNAAPRHPARCGQAPAGQTKLRPAAP